MTTLLNYMLEKLHFAVLFMLSSVEPINKIGVDRRNLTGILKKQQQKPVLLRLLKLSSI